MSLFDRVRDTTTTTGTGSLTLADSAPTGFRTFGSVLNNNERFYGTVAHQTANEWETGYYTYSTTGPSLVRTTVLASSNAGAAVNFSAGTKDVFCTPPGAVFGDRLPEISITGATTATIDRMHVCSGTSADYTVTLPAAANNAGRRLWFRMASGLTRFVTLDGNGSETIDGATTRVMWAGETAELLCDGSNWFKVAGRTVPMTASSRRDAVVSGNIANNTVVLVPLNVSVSDPTGAMVDTTTGQIVVRRPGLYEAVALLTYANSAGTTVMAASAFAQCRIHRNDASSVLAATNSHNTVSWTPITAATAVATLAASDGVRLYAFQTSGAAANVLTAASSGVTTMSVVEVPQW